MEYVYYEDFGAVGDGRHSDAEAMAKAHKYANERHLPVKAREGATYYIGRETPTIEIRTSTAFTGATVIIDDSEVSDSDNYRQHIFTVTPDNEPIITDITSLVKGQTALLHGYGQPMVIRVFDEGGRKYIRKGLNANAGVATTDVLIADADGKLIVGPDWDYPQVTSQYGIIIDDPITIEGGTFITVANRHKSEIKYYNRGFLITRSNVTVEGMTHLIEGEGDEGAPYSGFINSGNSYRLTVKNCLLTPHKTYHTNPSDPKTDIHIGTYDIGLNSTVETSLINVTQTRDITDKTYWGIMGTNHCKRMLLENCVISRFDAHMGVSSATVRGCKLGHQCLSLIGFGEFTVEDSSVMGYGLIALRGDYGSHFDGKITIKNCTWHPVVKKNLQVIVANNTGDHDFGYECRMPHTIDIDGLYIEDGDADEDASISILPDYDLDYKDGKPYPYRTTSRLSVKGVRTETGRKIIPFSNPEQYKGIEVKTEE